MGTRHKEEYANSQTIEGWKEGDEYDEFVELLFKDVHNQTTKEEQIAIEIYYLLGYNAVDYIPNDEILNASTLISKLLQPTDISLAFAVWMEQRKKSHIKFRLAYPTIELFNEFYKTYTAKV